MKIYAIILSMFASFYVNADQVAMYSEYHNVDTSAQYFKVDKAQKNSTLPIVTFSLAYVPHREKCSFTIMDHSVMNDKGQAETSNHTIDATEVNARVRMCLANLGGDFSYCHLSESSTTGKATLNINVHTPSISRSESKLGWELNLTSDSKEKQARMSVICKK